MRTHVGLLRGINVGGRNRLAMADLRDTVTALGLDDVATYIQSGNVVFTCRREADPADLAAELERAIAERSAVRPAVVVLPRARLAAVVAGNPYPQEADPRRLHVVFSREPFGSAAAEEVEAASQRAQNLGSRDEAAVRGGCLYLRTPDGLGRSVLATELSRPRAAGTTEPVTTMRNWATVTRLQALLDG